MQQRNAPFLAFKFGFLSLLAMTSFATADVWKSRGAEFKDGIVTHKVAANELGHVERAGEQDNVTIFTQIERWGAIYLVWDADNWCGVGKISPTPFGRFYSIDVEGGKPRQVDHRGIDFNLPHVVRVQLSRDFVRFQYQSGGEWIDLRTIERPKNFSGAPKLLAAGKSYLTGDKPFGAGEIVSVTAGGSISNLKVEATSTFDEVPKAAKEPVNAILDGNENDPTFEEVARHYPVMKSPREVVGVAAHPLDIGIDRLGRLDVTPWGPPIAWFEIGETGKSFGADGVDQSKYTTWDRSAATLNATEKPGQLKRCLQDGYLPIVTLSREIDGSPCVLTIFGYSENFATDKDLFAYVRIASKSKSAAMVWKDGGKKSFSTDQCLRFKYPNPETAEIIPLEEFEAKRTATAKFWSERLAPASAFDLPDTRVMEAYRAWLVYSMLNSDTVNSFLEPHDGAGFYEEMFGNSVSLYTMALDMYGFHDLAAKAIDTQIHYQQPDGLYTQACGLVDPGGFLAGIAQHYRITRDADWLKRVSPNVVKQCQWLMQKRAAAPKEGMLKGLIKFRPYNDYPDPVFNYLGNAWCAQGMKLVAAALKEVGVAEADVFATEAEAYCRDVLASMDSAAFRYEGQTLMPMEPDTHRMLKLSNHRGGDYWGLVASPLLAVGLLPHDDKRTSIIVDMIEQRGGLVGGVCEFEDGIDHAYTYGYLLNAMKRGEPRKTLLGFWSFMAYGMTRDTYSPVEVTMVRTGENQYTLPHLYSCTEQLRLLRSILMREDGEVLHIGEAIPRAWLEKGKHVAITKAPTEFGPVSFRIEPLDDGTMQVTLDPPARRTPKEIRITLRDPQMRKIASAATKESVIDVKENTLVIHEPHDRMTIDVKF